MKDKDELLGMSDDDLLKLMDENSAGWHTAGTQEQKDAYHAENVMANQILDSRRGETTSFDPDSGTWSPRKSTTAAKAGTGIMGGSGEKFTYAAAPTYTSKYKSQINDLAAQLLGREAFSYDPETDPTYQQYKESYTRGGERAMKDTLGQVSARTGGLASSYATSAAQQSYNGYMAALADKIPELKQLAYQMYRDEGATQRSNLEMLLALEQGDYAKYQDLLSQYNADRSFDYGVWGDQRNYDYMLGRDALSDERYEDERAYSRQQDAARWDYDLAGREHDWARQERQDAMDAHDREVSEAADIYSATGDVTRLADVWGLTPESAQILIDDYAEKKRLTRQEAAIQLARSKGEIGDLSGYEGLGWDTGYLKQMQDYELQKAAAGLVKERSGDDKKSDDPDGTIDDDTVESKPSDVDEYTELEAGLDELFASGASVDIIHRALKEARDEGVITDEEYRELRKEYR